VIAQAVKRDDQTNSEVATECGVSESTVKRTASNLFHFRTDKPETSKRGRKRTLNAFHKEWILELLLGRPSLLAAEVTWEFFDEFDVVITPRVVFDTLKRRGFTRKVLRRDAAQRSQLLRNTWIGTMALYSPHQLVFVDESAANEKTGWRKFGWSPQGHEAVTVGSLRRSERYSILSCLTLNGYTVGTLIVQGSITQAIFNDWIRSEVLPRCNPFPAANSVIILDNCVVYKHANVKLMCTEAGIKLLFLPPYSPDFNPIEETFNVLKTWIRSNARLIDTFPEFSDFLRHAVEHSYCDWHGPKMYKDCGYEETILNTQ